MIEIAIVDDEKSFSDALSAQINDYFSDKSIPYETRIFDSGDSFLAARAKSNTFTIIFLDIYMNGTDGIRVAETLRDEHDPVLVIFSTTSADHMQDAFRFHAYDYLIKPASPERFTKLMDDVLRSLPDIEHSVRIPDGRQTMVLYCRDIVSIVTSGHYLLITTARNKTHKIRETLSEFLTRTGDPRFLVINRGIAVNMEYISKIDGNICTLVSPAGEEALPIKIRDQASVKQAWHDFIFKNQT